MRKIILLGLLMVAVMIHATETIKPGYNILVVSDKTTFSSEKLKGGGDTVWTREYDFNMGGFNGVFALSFDIDTSAACSTKIQIILQEGNTLGDWDLLTTIATIDHALADWDTTIEVEFLPAMFWRIGFVQTNGSNDSTKLSNVLLFGIKE